MESRCISRYIRIAPRKLRLVADLVRGRKVEDALAFLPFVQKKGAPLIEKAINSAVANATNLSAGKKVRPEEFYVKGSTVDEGIGMKRFRAASQGRGSRIRKRLSTLSVILSDQKPVKPKRFVRSNVKKQPVKTTPQPAPEVTE